MVFFEAPHRLVETLRAIAEVFGARAFGGRLPGAHQDL